MISGIEEHSETRVSGSCFQILPDSCCVVHHEVSQRSSWRHRYISSRVAIGSVYRTASRTMQEPIGCRRAMCQSVFSPLASHFQPTLNLLSARFPTRAEVELTESGASNQPESSFACLQLHASVDVAVQLTVVATICTLRASKVLGRRGHSIKVAAVRISSEARARVRTFLSGTWISGAPIHDSRRLEILADCPPTVRWSPIGRWNHSRVNSASRCVCPSQCRTNVGADTSHASVEG